MSDWITSLKIIKFVEEAHFEVCYIDEFKFSAHNNKQYGWIQKGKSLFIMLILVPFQLASEYDFQRTKYMVQWCAKKKDTMCK